MERFTAPGLLLLLAVFALTVSARATEFDGSYPALVASRVLVASEQSSVHSSGSVRESVVRQMVDRLLLSLTGRRSVSEAWLSLVQPGEVVGIKVSVSGGRIGGTRIETVQAVIDGLRAAGFSREQIIVWDREKADLLVAGFSENHPAYTLRWVDAKGGFDHDTFTTSPLIGQLIWGDHQFQDRTGQLGVGGRAGGQYSSKSHFARVLSDEVTKVIHVPSLQDHFLTGINGALVGMTLHNLDNWRRFASPPGAGAAYLAETYGHELIAGKVVLTIMDGLFLQYAGGPFPSPAETIENFSILMGYDPVALDAVAREFLNEARLARRLPKLEPLTQYIESAEAMGLGLAALDKIQFREIVRTPQTGRR
jgi:hypothetical protein